MEFKYGAVLVKCLLNGNFTKAIDVMRTPWLTSMSNTIGVAISIVLSLTIEPGVNIPNGEYRPQENHTFQQ